jgi:hypothetical protein
MNLKIKRAGSGIPGNSFLDSCQSKILGLLTLVLLLLSGINSAYALSVVRGPYIQSTTPDSVTIRWRTDSASTSQVQFGTTQSILDQSESDFGTTTDHEIVIDGLNPDARYYYSVGSTTSMLAGDTVNHYFETSPIAGTLHPSRIWVLGDSGTADAKAAAVRDAFYNYPPPSADLILMLGDNAYSTGTDSEYQAAVFNMYPDILRNTTLWSTLGNHDGANASTYYDIFTFPTNAEAGGMPSGTEAYYSFDYANIHFVCLDSFATSRSTSDDMYNWLSTDLANTSQEWIVAFWHHPPYTKGSHNSDTEGALIDMRTNFLPLLESHGVDLVLGGHSHSYERSFLLDGHYGNSSTLTPDMILDDGSGKEDSADGAYNKIGNVVNDGAVYIVAGSSGKISGGSLDHPAMYVSLNELGSLVIDINGNRLDVSFLNNNRTTTDHFTILKGPDTSAPTIIQSDAISASEVDVIFSEPLETSSAEFTANYAIDNSINVHSASLLGNDRTVRLSVDPLTENVTYNLTVTGVEDWYSNAVLPPGEQTSFEFLNQITSDFQNGVDGYTGTQDSYIAQGVPDTNYGPGNILLVDGNDGVGEVDLSTLVKWDVSTIPSEAIVDAAEFSVNVINVSSQAYSVYALNQAWNESEVTWNQASNSAWWQIPGATGSGDRSANPVGTLVATSTGTATVMLNAEGVSAVQNWVDNPSTNHGFIIANTDNADGIDLDSSESGISSNGPKLSVTYHSDAPDSEAPSVPGNLQVDSVTTDSIDLSWNASTDNEGVSGYDIFREGSLLTTITGTSYTDTGLTAGATYGYQVRAFDFTGNQSALSGTVSGTTDDIAVDVITVIEARYRATRDEFKVRATSSAQPEAMLEVVDFGLMTFKKNNYEYKLKPVGSAIIPQTIDIVSSKGGLITVPVVGAPTPQFPGQAGNPSPGDGDTNVDLNVVLNWSAGSQADTHTVYFGTNSSPPQVSGNQSTTSYDPGGLAESIMYYWRVDETNAQGTTAGSVWSFMTRDTSAVDTVVITKAEWKASRQELKVEATSSGAPGAVLTVEGDDQEYGQMVYNSGKNKYSFIQRPVDNPGSVTVNSSLNGYDSTAVRSR